jgi:hypothetical protein
MQYNLATGATRTLYQGLTEAFVPYQSMVLYSAIVKNPPPFATNTGNGPPEDLRAVDQATGAQVTPPPGITFAADGAETVVTSGDALVWNVGALPGGGMRAWRPAWGRSITILPNLGWPLGTKLEMSSADMPRLYDHFVVFQPSSTYLIDLHTNTFARFNTLPGSEEVTGSQLNIEHFTTATSFTKNEANLTLSRYQMDQYLIDMSHLPDLPGPHGLHRSLTTPIA